MKKALRLLFGVTLAGVATVLGGATSKAWADDVGAICSSGSSNLCNTTTTTSYNCTREVLSLSGTWQCMEWSQTTTTKSYYWSSSTGTGSTIPKK
jgi:hypothetical protein